MKYAALALICLFLAGRTHAQTTGAATAFFDKVEETKLKVLLTKEGMTVTYLNKPTAITTIQSLDSLVKKIPDPQHTKIEFEAQNADKDQSLAITRTLEKCNCHLVAKSVAFANQSQ